VTGELALVREAGLRGDLRQGEIAAGLQKLLGSFDATADYVFVRRQSGRRLELPREMVRAETGDSSHLFQGRAGVEVFLDVLDDGAEPPLRERAVRAADRQAGRQASGPPAPPAVSSASTAHIAARRRGRSGPSSGGTVSRAGSRSNSSAATRATRAGSR
jgi:hypothetical protein